MENIRPISDLRNNFSEISRQVNENNETIFLTKNGYGNMVVMSIEEYHRLNFENEVVSKLHESEIVSKKSDKRFSHDEVISRIKDLK